VLTAFVTFQSTVRANCAIRSPKRSRRSGA